MRARIGRRRRPPLAAAVPSPAARRRRCVARRPPPVRYIARFVREPTEARGLADISNASVREPHRRAALVRAPDRYFERTARTGDFPRTSVDISNVRGTCSVTVALPWVVVAMVVITPSVRGYRGPRPGPRTEPPRHARGPSPNRGSASATGPRADTAAAVPRRAPPRDRPRGGPGGASTPAAAQARVRRRCRSPLAHRRRGDR